MHILVLLKMVPDVVEELEIAPSGKALDLDYLRMILSESDEHALEEARRLGFRAMQFNFVVSTNQPAIRLWQDLGFKIVGTLPGAFRHADEGFVDAFVMFRPLT